MDGFAGKVEKNIYLCIVLAEGRQLSVNTKLYE